MPEAIPSQPAAETVATNQKTDANLPAPAGDAPVTKEAAREAIRKHKLKVDGEEIEVDEDELKRGYSHQRAANRILQEGKAARKQAEEFISMMKDKGQLKQALQKLGYDPRALAEEMLIAELEEEKLDPRDRELRDTKTKLKTLEDLDKRQKEAVEAKRDAELKTKFAADYTKQFTDALGESKLPANKQTVAKMAGYIHQSAKLGFKMTAIEAAQLVKEDIQAAHQALLGNSDADMLISLLGEDGIKKIQQHSIDKLRSPDKYLSTPQGQGEVKRINREPKQRMTARDWREFNRK